MLKNEETKQKMKNKNVQRKNHGITLIALVITIIVLLILAGVSINMLIGENGLLTKSQDAANENTRGGARDKVATSVYASYNTDYNPDDLKLKIDEGTLKANIEKAGGKITSTGGFPVTAEMDGYEFWIYEYGGIKERLTIVDGVKIPKGYIASADPNEDTVKEGLVIIDNKGNEYVWIEVPKTVYQEATVTAVKDKEDAKEELEDVEYNLIYEDLKTYGSAYNARYSGGDVWYAWKDNNEDGSFDSSELYVENENKTAQLDTTIKELNTGCGLNYDDYYELKNKMLKSIYENGGFWIGRYEAGVETARTYTDNGNTVATALSQQDKYPYNYVTCSEAQTLASKMKASESNVTSSLMFGVQWNLVCKFIEKNVTTLGGNSNVVDAINKDSSKWGNYKGNATYPTEFEINRGQYTTNPSTASSWKPYTTTLSGTVDLVDGKYMKKNEKSVLLTTGASERNKVLNIYDFAGNKWEWTLEKTTKTSKPCGCRGGCYNDSGNDSPACRRDAVDPPRGNGFVSFRVSLY